MEEQVTTEPIKLMIVDDHAMVRKGMRAFLGEFDDIHVIGDASDGWKAIDQVKQLKPDVVLLDLFMPGMDGIETIQRLMAVQPHLRIVILTAFAKEDQVIEATRAGALGYVVKDTQPEDLVQSIRLVSTGTPAISPTIAWKILHTDRSGKEKTSGSAAPAPQARSDSIVRTRRGPEPPSAPPWWFVGPFGSARPPR